MKTTPKSLRLHIALFGRTNVGKSSFLNLITGQDVSIVSEEAGTTTDVVEKTMELLPIGPVVFIDTAGLDDETVLGGKRVEKTEKVFDRADVILLICDGDQIGKFEEKVSALAKEKRIPVLRVRNKSDLSDVSDSPEISCNSTDPSSRERVLSALKTRLLDVCPNEFISPPPLVGDLVRPGGVAMLIVPIDLQAPKGRLILPQVSTIRDALDNDAASLVVKEREYTQMLDQLKTPPDIVICDSQVVLKMVGDTPNEIPCTTFSILFARLKGDLPRLAAGAATIDQLKDGDKVLIAESCSHHAAEDDIGRVKIPRWLRQYTGCNLEIDVYAGRDFPDNLSEYSLVVQCGGCMHNRREILSRIEKCEAAGVPITNYGLCISQTQGVLKRVLSPFPAALDAFERTL
ncbi:[FeFe] hydrogenase H-cluster maturation GTPase HydF [Tichowtungia aerotolerans]|uniref:[FeFe] hydrogenase H-cluster maturation GTPase HydF n=1 Tax=Tichowtungia aerotolerans TaxID=2697043 RepID=A0A6P1M7P1_9BACT|nr:[FeFe] hydrogenase H-cluster maturation GTPase HydF [Tichowtungia aerotolerans]QHI69887.1 [FeFe] hydrogenase H-cluster maturation GTPase HydF [Tichowtungia aerotolerans]